MALQTIEKLKTYFFEHAYPTWQQFHDLLDSFRHKNDKVPISEVDGLSDVLNGKAASSAVDELIEEVSGKENIGVAKSLVDAEAFSREQGEATLQAGIDTVNNKVDNETTARQQGDNNLSQAVSDLNAALAIIQSWKSAMTDADSDNVINTLTELLNLAKNVPEGADLAALLAAKISTSDIVDNLTSVLINAPLSAYQGNVLKGLIDTLNNNLSKKENTASKGMPFGYAALDDGGKVPEVQLPASALGVTKSQVITALAYTPEDAAQKGMPLGYASLDGGGKVPEAQLPASALGVTKSQVTTALGYTPENVANKGVANGYTPLGYGAKIPMVHIPTDILENMYAYGVLWIPSNATPTLIRVGNMALHASLPIQNKMRGCLLDDAGNVSMYLNPTNWNTTLDGSKGQVMVEIPEYYYKWSQEGDNRSMMISEFPLPSYKHAPKRYISAYEASIQRSTGKLCSVANSATDYRGGDNTSAWDGTYRTLCGKPVTNLSRTAFRAAARLRGVAFDNPTGWNCLDYSLYKDVCWLFYIEYATFNSQAPFAAKDSNGYSTGGLGDGITTMADWGTYNNYNPLVNCGVTDSFGNGSGEINRQVGNTTQYVKANRYRGIENLFGHVWKWVDGVNIPVFAGVASVCISDTPESYSDSTCEGYEGRGSLPSSSGYMVSPIYTTPENNEGDILPNTVGGSSSSYWCDYYYADNSWDGIHGLLVGGAANHGVYAGLAYSSSLIAPSYANAYIGSRLCFIP